MKRVALVAVALVGCDGAESNPVASRTEHVAGFSEDECAACHPDAAAQWAGSRHHTAFTNADFQRSYAREPEPFCRDCHAPATKAASEHQSAAAESRGIGCHDCHGDGSVVRTGLGSAETAPHPIERSATFGTDSCAGCHEFEFPPSSRRPSGLLMQSTMEEHSESAFADRSCASCHFRSDDKGVDHSLSSTRDPQAWRRALQVGAQLDGEGIVFSLRPVGVGHALPTGDLFRRLALHVERRSEGEITASTTRYLARHFEPWRHPDGRLNEAYAWPVRDDRPRHATEISVKLESDASQLADEWRWWVDYQRVDAREDERPQDATIASTVRIASGHLQP